MEELLKHKLLSIYAEESLKAYLNSLVDCMRTIEHDFADMEMGGSFKMKDTEETYKYRLTIKKNAK